ncbi:MAG: hypothetical protein ACK5TN_19850 [Acidobacteriota bacterium]|jgi:hypothetical protein
MAVNSPYNSNTYTDREKKFLLGPLLMLLIAATVFLYVYSTIPSRPYELHEEAHAAGVAHGAEAGNGAAPAGGHEAKH